MKNPELHIHCCDIMTKKLYEDDILSLLTNEPFSMAQTDPTVYILSDGGHGGIEAIKYCPFCGTEIKFKT